MGNYVAESWFGGGAKKAFEELQSKWDRLKLQASSGAAEVTFTRGHFPGIECLKEEGVPLEESSGLLLWRGRFGDLGREDRGSAHCLR